MGKHKLTPNPDTPGQLSKENWDRWTNAQRLAWLRNFRDRLVEKGASTYYKNYDMTDADIERMNADIATLEQAAAKDKANAEVLRFNARKLFLPPDTILGKGKKGN